MCVGEENFKVNVGKSKVMFFERKEVEVSLGHLTE